MEAPLPAASTITGFAFALGLAFGVIGHRTQFCTLGAISDALNFGDWKRMRMWLLATATAVLGTGALQFAGLFDASGTIYTGSRLPWLSSLVGGLCFGAGMTLASGCGSKTLIRLGAGNLKSLVVFVFIAIGAYMTMRGLFAVWRVALLEPVAIELAHSQTLPAFLATAGISPANALLLATATVGGGLLLAALGRRSGWQADVLLGGVGVGLLCVAGWYLTGHIGHVAEHPETLEEAFIATNSGRAESLSFVAPLAYTLELLMLWSDRSRVLTFGIASSLGVIAGAALHALVSGSFRIESFRDPADLLRHISGGLLMGFGGVTALGCTIGQGISGFSTLALSSMLTTAAIVAGAVATMKLQYRLMAQGT